jgi:hypothetical protein
MKNRTLESKTLAFLAIIFVVGAVFIFSFPAHAQNKYNYTQLEPIPGSENAGSDLKSFVGSIYKFGIWTVGIAAVLMITIGGFMYLTSAGNTSKMDSAKRVIMNAVIGLIAALTAYLILYVINPDLVNTNIGMNQLGTSQCTPVTTGACSVDNLEPYFGDNAEKASAICSAESGGEEGAASATDTCQPSGPVASWGLFQINLTANSVGGYNCPSAFSSQYTSTNHSCTVVNQTLYNQCVAAATDADTNIRTAVSLSNGGTSWGNWGANSICRF